ncbi:MAG: hypothetical protein HOI47_11015 [Candidatus Scalindua sp.]|nr:hypothetical protein [Candidatus Scalindua sp.]MBT6227176.1 hypothetical protein [Candidatus Scalindua sp.]
MPTSWPLGKSLRKAGLKVEQQYPLQVVDEDGMDLGDFIADLYVEDCLVVELKASVAKRLDSSDES